jgi:hypothetical protein
MEAPVVKFKKRGAKAAPRKVAPPPPQSDSDFSSGSEAEGEDGRVVKRRKTNGNALKASTADQKTNLGFEGTTKYEADRSAVIEQRGRPQLEESARKHTREATATSDREEPRRASTSSRPSEVLYQRTHDYDHRLYSRRVQGLQANGFLWFR